MFWLPIIPPLIGAFFHGLRGKRKASADKPQAIGHDEEVLRMARDAGFSVDEIPSDPKHLAALLKSDKWRWAIDRELVMAELGIAHPDGNPVELLNAVIQWHVDVALDPRVSAAARKLQEDAAAAERDACAKVCDDLPLPAEFKRDGSWPWEAGANACVAAIRARDQSIPLADADDLRVTEWPDLGNGRPAKTFHERKAERSGEGRPAC